MRGYLKERGNLEDPGIDGAAVLKRTVLCTIYTKVMRGYLKERVMEDPGIDGAAVLKRTVLCTIYTEVMEEIPERKSHLEDPGIDGAAILKWNWIHVTQDGVQCRLL
jgi:hypothetical protein